MKKEGKTAIIVVNYRTPWHLDKCLAYLFKYTRDFHLYLVNNKPDKASLRITQKYLGRYPRQITVFENKQNLGFVGGVNTAYTAAMEHEYICLLNSDVLVTKNWLNLLVGALDADSSIAQVAPDTNQYYPESFFWKFLKYFVGRISRQLWYYVYLLRYYLNPPRNDLSGFNEYPYFWQFGGGFCTVFRTKHIKPRGYILDPKIVHGYWDDNELGFYLRQFGRIGRMDDAYVFHFLNVSFDQVSEVRQDLKKNLQQLNGYYVMQKWGEYLHSEVAKIGVEKLIEFARNVPEIAFYLEYLGVKQLKPELTGYLAANHAKEIGDQFLN